MQKALFILFLLVGSMQLQAQGIASDFQLTTSNQLDGTNFIMPLEQYDETTFADVKRFSVLVAAGFLLGQEADFYSFQFLVAASYLIVRSGILELGPSLGLTRFFGKDTDFGFRTDAILYLPFKIAASINLARILAIQTLRLNAGLGYAVGLSENTESGLAYDIGASVTVVKPSEKQKRPWRGDLGASINTIKVTGGNIRAAALSFKMVFGAKKQAN